MGGGGAQGRNKQVQSFGGCGCGWVGWGVGGGVGVWGWWGVLGVGCLGWVVWWLLVLGGVWGGIDWVGVGWGVGCGGGGGGLRGGVGWVFGFLGQNKCPRNLSGAGGRPWLGSKGKKVPCTTVRAGGELGPEKAQWELGGAANSTPKNPRPP